jgi:succinate-semialdehyde dehydrogenase/glutarate-semialdehyde dehydrogenase
MTASVTSAVNGANGANGPDAATAVTAALLGVPTTLFIGGRWRSSADGSTMDVSDPSTGNIVAVVADGAVEDGLAAVDAAAAALPVWALTAPRRRGEILRRAFELMTERSEELARLIVVENGKALPDARSEVAYAAEFFRWFSEEAVRVIGDVQTAPSGANRIMVLRQPIGVCVLVTPWNFPAAMATRKIAPALAAGCTTILKPASETPLTALAIAKILQEAGVPDGVVNVVPSRRSGSVVSAMLHDPRVRKLSFTGSTEVGQRLLREAADGVVSTAMELGGNAPFIVFDDADLDAAVSGAMLAKMRNGGEACTAANRFYVQRGVHDAFVGRFAAAMAAVAMGPGLDAATQLGPMVNAAGRDKVVELVSDALGGGASIVTGGKSPDGAGYFYPPTVLVDVPGDAAILAEEIFGPVAPVVRFDDEADVIASANSTPYGLVAYVYTANLAKALRVSEALEFGMVGINRALVSDPAAPFGGVKHSGLGREGGHDGLLEYLESKYLALGW